MIRIYRRESSHVFFFLGGGLERFLLSPESAAKRPGDCVGSFGALEPESQAGAAPPKPRRSGGSPKPFSRRVRLKGGKLRDPPVSFRLLFFFFLQAMGSIGPDRR